MAVNVEPGKVKSTSESAPELGGIDCSTEAAKIGENGKVSDSATRPFDAALRTSPLTVIAGPPISIVREPTITPPEL